LGRLEGDIRTSTPWARFHLLNSSGYQRVLAAAALPLSAIVAQHGLGVCDAAHWAFVMKKTSGGLREWGRSRHPTHRKERDEWGTRLHEFVLMPDHFHLLVTPLFTLERALQLIKGGFSFRAKRELGFQGEIWEKSFYDRRVRGWGEYSAFCQYIRRNPVKRGLASVPEEYPYSSARGSLALDAVPQRLKSSELGA